MEYPECMWHAAPQAEPEEEEEEKLLAPLADGAKSGAPWVLKRANSMGATRLYAEPGSQGDMSGRLYFAGALLLPGVARLRHIPVSHSTQLPVQGCSDD